MLPFATEENRQSVYICVIGHNLDVFILVDERLDQGDDVAVGFLVFVSTVSFPQHLRCSATHFHCR